MAARELNDSKVERPQVMELLEKAVRESPANAQLKFVLVLLCTRLGACMCCHVQRYLNQAHSGGDAAWVSLKLTSFRVDLGHFQIGRGPNDSGK